MSPKLIVILILKKVILLQKLMAINLRSMLIKRSYLYESKKPGEIKSLLPLSVMVKQKKLK